MNIRIANIIKESFVDGPGIRYTIFTQGCKHNCPGCHNPQTHDTTKGVLVDVDNILEDIMNVAQCNPLVKGVTFTGGEPLLQLKPLLYLCQRIRVLTDYNIWIYTGYTFEKALKLKYFKELLPFINTIVDGPYIEAERDLELQFRGSRNQKIIKIDKKLLEEINK